MSDIKDTENKGDVNLNDIYNLVKSGQDQKMKGEFDQAFKSYDEASDQSKRLQATIYDRLSVIECKKGNLEEAKKYANMGLELYKSVNDKKGVACQLVQLSGLSIHDEQLDEAQNYIDDAVKIADEICDPANKSLAYINKAVILRKKKWYMESADLLSFTTSMISTEGVKDRSIKGYVYYNLGLLYCIDEFQNKNIAQSKKYFQDAKDIFIELGDEVMEREIQSSLDDLS